jgi:hypothetical protein
MIDKRPPMRQVDDENDGYHQKIVKIEGRHQVVSYFAETASLQKNANQIKFDLERLICTAAGKVSPREVVHLKSR